jgi:uncharacterized protein YndB with AHSA1/START domain
MEARTIQAAPVRKSLVVRADPAKAFSVFASSMGRWWPMSHSIGSSPIADVIVEPEVGGRWFERGEDGTECDWGKVLAWEPPARILLAWQLSADWQYDSDLVTEVEVTFTPIGANETRVVLEHRKLEAFGSRAENVRAALDSDGGWTGIVKLFGEAAAA